MDVKGSAISVGKDQKLALTTDQGASQTDKLLLVTGVWNQLC
jgi:hypothetical protein